MPTKPYIIQFEEPCNESWSQMSPKAQGRFCQNCQKEVIDLSDMPDEKIVAFLEKANEQTCIRMRASQVGRDLNIATVSPPPARFSMPIAMISRMAAACIAFSASCGEVDSPIKLTNGTAYFVSEEAGDLSNAVMSITDDAENIKLYGIVYGWEEKPINGVSVNIKGTKDTVITNEKGEFNLSILKPKTGYFVLTCQKEDHTTFERCYEVGKIPQKLWIRLERLHFAGNKPMHPSMRRNK